jgi:O-antigen ligase
MIAPALASRARTPTTSISLIDLAVIAAAIALLITYTGVIIVRDAVFGLNGLTNEQLRFLAVPLTGFSLLMLIMHARRAGSLIAANAWLLALVAYAYASTLWSVDARTTNVRSVALLMSMICAFGLVARFEGLMLVRVVAIAMTAGTSLSVLFWMAGDPMVWDTLAFVGLRGVFSHKNLLGQCVVIALVTGAGLAMRRHWFDRALGLVTVLFALRALLLAQSATAYVSGAVGLAALGLLIVISRPWISGFLKPAIAILAGVAAIVVVTYRSTIIQWMGREENLTGRDAIWSFVAERIDERPLLGHGYRAYFTAPQNVDEIERVLDHGYDQAHNSILQVLLDLGFVGLALLGLFLLFAALRAPRAVFDPARKIWLALIAALLFNSLTEALIMSPTGFTWLILQVAVIALFIARPSTQMRILRPKTSWPAPMYRLRK